MSNLFGGKLGDQMIAGLKDQSQINASISDAKAYAGMPPQVSVGPALGDTLQGPPLASAPDARLYQGPVMTTPLAAPMPFIPIHQPHQPQILLQPTISAAPPTSAAGAAMARDFDKQMQMNAHFNATFGAASAAPVSAAPVTSNWSQEFARQQQQQQQQMAQLHAQQVQAHAHAQAVAAHQHQMQMNSLASIYSQAAAGPPSAQWGAVDYPSLMRASSQGAQAPMVQQVAASSAPVEAAPVETAQSFTNDSAPAAGMGMGMDKAMIDALRNSSDPKWRNSKFLKFISRLSNGEIEFKDNKVVEKTPETAPAASAGQLTVPRGGSDAFFDELRDMDSEIDWNKEIQRQQDMLGPAADWSDDFGDMRNFDMNAAMQKAMAGLPQPADPEYKFAADNPMAKKQDAFQEGLRLLKLGELKQAIVCFEAEVQENPDNAEAWRYLGQCQAENEQETHAIAALLKCISIDPYNLKALMMLGVSYTNDLEEVRALNYLKTWLLNNPDYQNSVLDPMKQALEIDEHYASSSTLDLTLHDQVTKMFLQAVEINPKDADLHTVLGVLYHITNDFDKSIECFKIALKLRPDDPGLWNKLGATQANSSRSADAVNCYKRALTLRPGYVRALANLAISYANQGLHEDAARTYLATLARNPEANHVWSYLRISLSHLGKEELVELTHQKKVEPFRDHFKF